MKKFLAILLAMAMMTVALSACSSNTGTTNNGGSTGNTTTGNNTSGTDETGDTTGDYGEFTTVEPGKLIMSTNAAFPPYEMTTDDGGFEGIDVEVAAAIAEKLGLELEVADMGFDAALTAVQTGQSDIAMAGISVTGPVTRMTDETIRRIQGRLAEAAGRSSRALGYQQEDFNN